MTTIKNLGSTGIYAYTTLISVFICAPGIFIFEKVRRISVARATSACVLLDSMAEGSAAAAAEKRRPVQHYKRRAAQHRASNDPPHVSAAPAPAPAL
mgnify:CR=1 FL=1